jgi:hypothetical protein
MTWDRNDIQFPRLLAELAAAGLLSGDYNDLLDAVASSMDLEPQEITELFDRAQDVWDRIVADTPNNIRANYSGPDLSAEGERSDP